jgi:hypothetical protein
VTPPRASWIRVGGGIGDGGGDGAGGDAGGGSAVTVPDGELVLTVIVGSHNRG